MATIKGLNAKIELHPQYNVPRHIYDFQQRLGKVGLKRTASVAHLKGGDAGLKETAEAFLKKVAKDLKIEPDLSQLKFDKVLKTVLGSHVLFQQYEDGKPISGAWVKVDIDKVGNCARPSARRKPTRSYLPTISSSLPRQRFATPPWRSSVPTRT